MTNERSRQSPLGPPLVPLELFVLSVWFAFWTRPGWRGTFVADDLMNLWLHLYRQGWPANFLSVFDFTTPLLRNAGALFYVPLFRAFKFDAPPYHAAQLCLLLANAFVWYQVIGRTAGLRGALPGMAAILFLPMFSDIYFGLHTVYDSLCSLFMWSAFWAHAAIRKAAPGTSAFRIVVTAVLFVLALSAKEMAMALPLLLLAYEWLLVPRGQRKYDTLYLTSFLSIACLMTRVIATVGDRSRSGYALELSIPAFLDHWGHYIRWFSDFHYRSPVLGYTVLILAGPLLIAAALRNFAAIFGWLVLLIGAMPVMFAAARNGYVLFVPFLGAGIWFGAITLEIERRLRVPRLLTTAAIAALIAYVSWSVGDRYYAWMERDSAPIRSALSYLQSHPIQVARGGRVLVLDDPFPADDYALHMLLALYLEDPSVQVDRLKFGHARKESYDAVIEIGAPR